MNKNVWVFMGLVWCNWIRKFASARVYNDAKSFLCPSLTIFDHDLDEKLCSFSEQNLSITNTYVCAFLITYLIILIMIIRSFFGANLCIIQFKRTAITRNCCFHCIFFSRFVFHKIFIWHNIQIHFHPFLFRTLPALRDNDKSMTDQWRSKWSATMMILYKSLCILAVRIADRTSN